jgi:chorismate synthase
MGIPGVKGVEVGLGFAASRLPGSRVHDEIFYRPDRGYFRETNRAGGLEGGVTNGEPLVLRGAMKPIATLMRPLRSVDIETREEVEAQVERSDVVAVPAASVVARAQVAFVLAQAVLEKFGGDSLEEVRRNLEGYRRSLEGY